jgi:predicted RNA-binding protein with PIN domain
VIHAEPDVPSAPQSPARRRAAAAPRAPADRSVVMHFVVDGHNAIHRLRLDGQGIADLRRRLVKLVRAHVRRGAQVIFDGHPESGAFGRSDEDGVDVRYAGDREADEEIADVIRGTRTPSRYTVVTDDLALARRVEQMGAQSLRVREFFDEDEPGRAADETKPQGRRATAGFSAADFGLPEVIDLNAPPPHLDPKPFRRKRLRDMRGIPPN